MSCSLTITILTPLQVPYNLVNVSALRHTVQTRRITQYITGGNIIRNRDRSDSELIINTEYHRDKDKDHVTRISIPEASPASTSTHPSSISSPTLTSPLPVKGAIQKSTRSRQNSAASVQQSQQRIDIVNDLKRGLTELSKIYDDKNVNETYITTNNTSIPSSSSFSGGNEHSFLYITIDQSSETTAKLELVSDNQRDVDMYLSYLYEVGVGRTFGSIICTPSSVLSSTNHTDTFQNGTSSSSHREHDATSFSVLDEKLLISIERDNLVEYITQWYTLHQQWLFTILSTILVTIGFQQSSIVVILAGTTLNSIAHTLVALCVGLLSNDYELAYRALITICVMNGISVAIAAFIGFIQIHLFGMVEQPDYIRIIGNQSQYDIYNYNELISYLVIGCCLGCGIAHVQAHSNIISSVKFGISAVILPLTVLAGLDIAYGSIQSVVVASNINEESTDNALSLYYRSGYTLTLLILVISTICISFLLYIVYSHYFQHVSIASIMMTRHVGKVETHSLLSLHDIRRQSLLKHAHHLMAISHVAHRTESKQLGISSQQHTIHATSSVTNAPQLSMARATTYGSIT